VFCDVTRLTVGLICQVFISLRDGFIKF